MEFRVVGPADTALLAEVFADIDETFFRPHPFTAEEARVIAETAGRDTYAVLLDEGRPVAYGMLRGWDDGHLTPWLGIAVRTSEHRRGYGRALMRELHAQAWRQGALRVRLRVHPDNHRARRLYESLGYWNHGEERGELLMLFDLDGPEGPWRHAKVVRGGMTATLVDVSAPECIAFLGAVPHDFYHLPAYVRLCADREHGVAKALIVDEDGRRLFLPLVLRSIPGTDRHDAVSPYGYPGPLVDATASADFVARAFDAGLAALAEDGAVSAFVRFHPLQSPEPPGHLVGATVQGITVSSDLTLPGPVLWEQTRNNHRRGIVRAVEEGMVARVDWRFERYGALKEVYRTTMERRGASAFYFFDDAYWEGLRQALGDRMHLVVVERGEDLAAAGLFIESDGIVQYHLGGSDAAIGRGEASKLMIHFARGWAKERGNHYLSLGGGVGSAADSLLHFKLGFSPLTHPFYVLRAILDEDAYRGLVALRDPARDPMDRSGFFPAYRAS